MTAEIKLSDGTTLQSEASASEIMQKLASNDRFVRLETEEGEFEVNPKQVTYVRDFTS